MKWLMSYQYRARFRSSHIHEPHDSIIIIDKHPALHIAEHKMDYNKTDTDLDDRLADEILRVYWAIEIPDGLLTDDQIDALS